MKRKLISAGILCVVFGAAWFGGIGLAGEKIVGGNSPAAVNKPEVVAAAKFAIQEEEAVLRKNKEMPAAKLSLVSIVSAEEQVVAGMNYHLKLKVKLDGKEKTAAVTVWWQAWNKETPYRLTAWNWL